MDVRRTILLFAVHLDFITASVFPQDMEVKDYCQWELFEASCPSSSVVVMGSALYGRMEAGRCVKRDYGYVGCTADVMTLCDARCSGRRSCQIRIPDMLFDTISQCPEDLRRYLKASYSCVPVLDPGRDSCQGMDYARVTSSSGLLASAVTMETGCGSAETPWLLTVPKGQRINLTLYDFGRAPSNINDTTGHTAQHCHVYAIIKEAETTRSITVCGGNERIKQIYQSTSNTLEIRVIAGQTRRNSAKYFLIDFKPVGCPDVPPPRGGWARRDDATLVVGCDVPERSWSLTCNGTAWKGKYENCTSGGFFNNSVRIGSLPHASSVLVIILVAVFVGLLVVLFGLIVLKRKYRLRNTNRRQQRESSDRTKPALHPDGTYAVGREYNQTKPQPLLSYQDKIEENEYAYVDEIPQILAAAKAQNTLNAHRDMSDYRGTNLPYPSGGGTLGNRRGINAKGDMIPQYFVLDSENDAGRHCADIVNSGDYLYEKQRCKMHRPVTDPRDMSRAAIRTNTLPR